MSYDALRWPPRLVCAGLLAALAAPLAARQANPPSAVSPGLQTKDAYQLRSVGDVQVSPDGSRLAYAVISNGGPGRPASHVWLMDVQSGTIKRLGTDEDAASGPRFSPDGARLAYFGHSGEHSGLIVADADGSGAEFLAAVEGTNHPLPSSGDRLAWSPDSRQIAFVSATPGPESDANGDPMVITRYLYKPTASEGGTRFNDNRRLHLFVSDLATRTIEQLTEGPYYEHSIDWSPDGQEILFVSNRQPDPDRFFNYDVFTVNRKTRDVRRLSDTKSAEYYPKWSPDGRSIAFSGTTRPLTSSETTMEDTHVWVMQADGSRRREVGVIDNRQGAPEWSADGRSLYFTLQERGSVRLVRMPVDGGRPDHIVREPGSVGAWGVAHDGSVGYAFTTPAGPAELYLVGARTARRQLTSLNKELLERRTVADVEAVTFESFDGVDIEAFLTKPVGLQPTSKYPMVVMIHGGPHGQQGPAFNQKAQVYAAQGWASLMVNYRGSTGYGQRLADRIFKDQNGGEAKDVLAGVDTAVAKYRWIDEQRLGIEGGSYGGQLTNWIITQTDRFKAAVPSAGISNLVSFNYTAYYHDYLAVEFGAFPHEQDLVDLLWQRSPIRLAKQVKTPTLFLHGENDNDVPIAEAEQLYIALKDVGVETMMVRYPREGHGIRETTHVVDTIERSIDWYRKHFTPARPSTARQ